MRSATSGLHTTHLRGGRRQGRQADQLRPGTARARQRNTAAEDADVTLRLHEALWPQLAGMPALARLYQEIEQPLVPVLAAHGALRRAGRPRAACARRAASSRTSCRSCWCRRTARPGTNSTSSRPSSCSRSCSSGCSCRCGGKHPDRAALHRRGRARGAGGELSRCRASCSSTGRSRSSSPPTPTSSRSSSTSAPAASTPPTRRRWPPPGACPRSIRTCRTSRCAARKGGASARPSSPPRLRAAGRGLLADRAAHHGAPLGGREPASGVRRRPRRAPGDRRGGVRRGARPRSAADQRRTAKVINFGLIYGMSALRPGAQPRHRAQRRAAPTSSATSSATRACGASWTTRARRRARSATSRRCSAGGSTCPTSAPATRSCASTPSAAPSTPPCRAPPPTSSSAP